MNRGWKYFGNVNGVYIYKANKTWIGVVYKEGSVLPGPSPVTPEPPFDPDYDIPNNGNYIVVDKSFLYTVDGYIEVPPTYGEYIAVDRVYLYSFEDIKDSKEFIYVDRSYSFYFNNSIFDDSPFIYTDMSFSYELSSPLSGFIQTVPAPEFIPVLSHTYTVYGEGEGLN